MCWVGSTLPFQLTCHASLTTSPDPWHGLRHLPTLRRTVQLGGAPQPSVQLSV